MNCCKLIFSAVMILSLISTTIFLYFIVVSILNITFYPTIYQWISVFGKANAVLQVLTVIGALSDFGYLLNLILFSYVMAKAISSFTDEIDLEWETQDPYVVGEMLVLLPITATLDVCMIIYEDVMLYVNVIYITSTCFIIACSFFNKDIFPFSTNRNIFRCDNLEYSYPKYQAFYVVCFAFILTGQFFIYVMAGLNYESCDKLGKAGIVIGIIIRIFELPFFLDVNIFDSIVYYSKTMENITNYDFDEEKLREEYEQSVIIKSTKVADQVPSSESDDSSEDLPLPTKEEFERSIEVQKNNIKEYVKAIKVSFWIAIAIEIIGIIAVITIAIYSLYKEKPNLDTFSYNASYKNSIWTRNKRGINQSAPGFCSIKPDFTKSLDLADIAMLTTLPRYYEISDGDFGKRCDVIKEKYSILKNTIYYIFGTTDIRIYCYPYSHTPYLVVASEALNNEMRDLIPDDEIESFYVNKTIAGLQDKYRYQIQLTEEYMAQPYIITKNGELYSGTHFVVGGGFEDSYGYGLLMENTARVYLPKLIESLIPFYSIASSIFKKPFGKISYFSYKTMYVESIGIKEAQDVNKVISLLNMSHKSIFLVGHSISGSAMKEVSFISDVKGVSFEATKGIGITDITALDSNNAEVDEEKTKRVANIYSESSFFSGNDADFKINGVLPSHFKNPNVFDTACQVAVSCSETTKYWSFCQQVLNQGGDPIKEFQSLIDAHEAHEY